jgi:phosphoribosyl-dephospho-CoA transferase
MILLFNRTDARPIRHDLAFLSSTAWQKFLETRPDLTSDPLISGWVERGWPLVVGRSSPDAASGLVLELPLPSSYGEERISVVMQPDDIIAVARPPKLSAAISVAPPSWRGTLAQIVVMAVRNGADVRVTGSLAWRMLTGLDYLTGESDVDLLISLPRGSDCTTMIAGLTALEATSPMRIDGEFVMQGGAAANWRELRTGNRDVLVKTARGAVLRNTNDFISGGVRL